MAANNFEWFQSNVLSLTNDNIDRISLLSELKIAFGALNSSQQKSITRSLKLDQIFDCLNSSETEQIELTCDVLSVMLSTVEPRVVFEQYEGALLRCLGHPAPCVKQLVLKELRRATSDDGLTVRMAKLLLYVIECLRHEDMSVAGSAVAVLVQFGCTPGGLDTLYCPALVNALKDNIAHNDVVRFRVYEVVVEVGVHSEAGLQRGHEVGLLRTLLAELGGDDVLLQMNALELLTRLALTEHGLHYLQQHGVLAALATKVQTIHDDPLASLTLPGLIKFFGNVAQFRPKEVFSEYPGMVAALFETFDTPDLVLLGVAMETVGYIGTSVEGKYMLNSLDDTMNQTMKKLALKIATLPTTEWKVRAINTVANLLQLKLPDQDTQSLAVTKCWFEMLGPNSMDLIMSLCRQPFPELRLAALQVVEVLAEQQWGQEYINNTPGLTEFLLDRSLENNKLCKDAQFEVVKTIVVSPTALTSFGAETFLRFRNFVREGPFFVEAVTEVAIEGAS